MQTMMWLVRAGRRRAAAPSLRCPAETYGTHSCECVIGHKKGKGGTVDLTIQVSVSCLFVPHHIHSELKVTETWAPLYYQMETLFRCQSML